MVDQVAPNGCPECEAACCRTCGHPPFETWDEVNALSVALVAELTAHYTNAGFDGPTRRARQEPCIWLDEENSLCLHYDDRPPICREYVVGSETCLGEIAYQERVNP